jgi:dCMP deaminase
MGVFPEHIEDWDEYFLWLAEAVARKSKDPRCRVGAVIVSADHLVLSTGFNGLARRIHDDESLLADASEKLKVICHAEANAIFNAARIGVKVEGASIYVTKFPCLTCCNAIIQAGIRSIYTHDTRFWDDDPLDRDHRHKRAVLKQSGVRVEAPFHPEYKPSDSDFRQSASESSWDRRGGFDRGTTERCIVGL